MKKIISSFLICILLAVSLVTPASASDNYDKNQIEQVINMYTKIRQDSFSFAGDKTNRTYSTNEYNLSEAVIADENCRVEKLKNMEKKLDIKLESAKTTTDILSIVEYNDEIIVEAYEWTFFDYIGEKGLLDTSGMGTDHTLTFIVVDDHYVLASDSYNEGPLTEMQSCTYIEPIENNTDVLDFQEGEFDIITPDGYAYYDSYAAVAYADQWVYSGAYGDVYNQYYNNAEYRNYNLNGAGGDCANYVSQCLFAGGYGMYGTDQTNPSYWFYHRNGTSSTTSDDYASYTWTSSTYQRNFFKSIYNNQYFDAPSSDYIMYGCPVYYDWTGDGGYTSYDHTTICAGYNSSGTPLVNSHNNDYYHVIWNYGGSSCKYSTVWVIPI